MKHNIEVPIYVGHIDRYLNFNYILYNFEILMEHSYCVLFIINFYT